jgi:hypothetical protein
VSAQEKLESDPWPYSDPTGGRWRFIENGVGDFIETNGTVHENTEIGRGIEWDPRLGFKQEPDPHDLIEAFVVAMTPMVTNRTAAYNMWNNIASDRGAIKDALEWAWHKDD